MLQHTCTCTCTSSVPLCQNIYIKVYLHTSTTINVIHLIVLHVSGRALATPYLWMALVFMGFDRFQVSEQL